MAEGELSLKAVIWLYLILFAAYFDLHAQSPVLTPFAASIGATPSVIGFIAGVYALAHVPGQWLAAAVLSKIGCKRLICFSLLATGMLMVAQTYVETPWQLLLVRMCSGFALAFLSPACLTLLAQSGADPASRERRIAGHGLMHMFASISAPPLGAWLASQMGFATTFLLLGCVLSGIGLLSLLILANRESHVNERATADSLPVMDQPAEQPAGEQALRIHPIYYALPFCLACSQAILYFELPFRGGQSAQHSLMETGLLFAVISVGAMLTLSVRSLHRISAAVRCVLGGLGLSAMFYLLAMSPAQTGMTGDQPIFLYLMLLLVGLCKGLLYPAISGLLTEQTTAAQYGRVFAGLSVCYSLGSFLGTMTAGQLRTVISPYFLAFVIIMLGLAFASDRLLTDNKSKYGGERKWPSQSL